MDIIYNILLIIVALLFLETLGNYIANKVFKRTFITNIPIGFVTYMAFFEVLNFFPMILHVSYSWVLYIVIPITLIIVAITFFINGKKTITDIKNKLKTKYYWLVIIMSTLFGIFVMFQSVANSDTILFMPLTLSGIQNGTIYSNSGFGNVVNYSSYEHVADGYYLFQSMMASISRIDPFTYLMGPYRIIESFVILSMFSIIIEVLFKKYKFGTFLVVSCSLFLGLSIFTPYITALEIYLHFFNNMATGTQMLICVFIPMLFIYYYVRNNDTNDFLFWIIITFGGLAFSSSSTFVICIFVFAIAIIDAFYLKNTSRYKYYLIPVLTVLFYFYSIFKLYDNVNDNYSLFLIIFVFISIIIYYIISKLSYNFLKNGMAIVVVMYIFFIVISFLNLDNTSQIINNVRSFNKEANYSQYSAYFYPSLIFSLMTSVLVVLGVYRFYKTDKKVFTYLLVVFVFFANVIVYSTLGGVISYAVYHRVFMLLVLNTITISGLVFLVEYISRKFDFEKKYIWLLIPLLMICFYDIPKKYQYDTSVSFTENKMLSSDLYDLYMYDFPESNALDITSVTPNITRNDNQHIDQIYQLRSDLQYTQLCESDCYELYYKGTTPDGEVVLETDKYILVYKEAK